MEEFTCECHNKQFKSKENLDSHLWHQKHPEHQKKWDTSYKKEKQEYMKEYNKTHKEERKQYQRKYEEDNKEKIALHHKKYHNTLEGKLAIKASNHNRKEILKTSSRLTKEIINQIYKKCTNSFGDYICVCCFKPIIKGQEELEHNIPVTRVKEFPGIDSNAISNLGLAHGRKSKENCNGHKSDCTLTEWFQKYPELLKEKNAITNN